MKIHTVKLTSGETVTAVMWDGELAEIFASEFGEPAVDILDILDKEDLDSIKEQIAKEER